MTNQPPQVSPKPLDQVVLVDESDNQLGVMDKIEAHRGDGQRHRAISVFLFNKDGQLLIQERSAKKIVGAGQWANTVCGNVRPGESYEACALRRLREELGITTAQIQPIHKFEYHTRCNDQFSEWEIDTVFVGNYDGPVEPNPDEVAKYEWKDASLLPKELAEDKRTSTDITTQKYAPWFHLLCQEAPVSSLLQ